MTRRQEPITGAAVRRLVQLAALVLLALAGAATAAQTGGEQAATKAARGKVTYRIYCANCHGAEGQGDGRLARLLTVKPADLTHLSEKGEFPGDDVRRAIDGRDEVTGHGMREMPVWGDVFQEPPGTPEGAEQAKAKIDDLVEYLRSIQRTKE